jgi:hypothetical protein
MHRIAWITAACIVDWYRENAIEVVQTRLNELQEEARSYWIECGVGVVV